MQEVPHTLVWAGGKSRFFGADFIPCCSEISWYCPWLANYMAGSMAWELGLLPGTQLDFSYP